MGIQYRPVDPTKIGSFGNGCSSLGPLKTDNGKTMKKTNGSSRRAGTLVLPDILVVHLHRAGTAGVVEAHVWARKLTAFEW
jgi:hypothetical protein